MTSRARPPPSSSWTRPSPRRLPCCTTSSRMARALPPPCATTDRKSTRLNSSHLVISYAVFCLKKKKIIDLVSLDVSCQDRTTDQCYLFVHSIVISELH